MVALSFPEVKDPVWFSVVLPFLSFNQEKVFILEVALHAVLLFPAWTSVLLCSFQTYCGRQTTLGCLTLILSNLLPAPYPAAKVSSL